MTGYVYPRMTRSEALRRYATLHDLPLGEIRAATGAPATHGGYVATGGTRVPAEQVRELQGHIRALADTCGWPRTLKKQEFDVACATGLLRTMRIIPADAAAVDVWSYIAIGVLPDVAFWRFPDGHQDRLLGSPRNTFRRLYWRAFVAGADTSDGADLLRQLNEDELVQVMERRTLAENPLVARTLFRTFLEIAADVPEAGRMELMRDAAKRLIRLTPYICLAALSSGDLEEVVRGAFTAGARAVSAARAD